MFFVKPVKEIWFCRGMSKPIKRLMDDQQKELNKCYKKVINGKAHLMSKEEFENN